MMFLPTTISKSISSFAVILLSLGSAACQAKSQAQKPVMGELKLQGKHIEHLVLGRNDGQRQVFMDPEETVKLPVGQYLLLDFRLKGGYNRLTMVSRQHTRIEISEDKPALLRVGGPLKQAISVQRHGRILELTYGLIGVGGETYAPVRNANKGPAFAVYKGDREIANGQFEFG